MSTKKTQQPSLSATIILLAGGSTAFLMLFVAPFVNLPIFASYYTATKFLCTIISGIIILLSILFAPPVIPQTITISRNILVLTFFVCLLVIASIVFSASPKASIIGIYGYWEHNFVTYSLYALLGFGWYRACATLNQFKLLGSTLEHVLRLLIILAVIMSLGDWYLWNNTTGYTVLSASRISLGFRNPLLAAYFVGMLAGYQTIKTWLTLAYQRAFSLVIIREFLLFVGISHALLLTFTRSAWLAFAATIIIVAMYWLIFVSQREIRLRSIFALLVICFTLAPQLLVFKEYVQSRNSDIVGDSQQNLSALADTIGARGDLEHALVFYQSVSQYSSARIRMLEWAWGLRVLVGYNQSLIQGVKNLLIGVGPDALFYELPRYRESFFNAIPTDASVKPYYIRNMYINFAVEHGLLLFVVTLLLGVRIASMFHVRARSANNAPEKALTLLPLASLIVGFALQGIFYSPDHISIALLIITFCALYCAITSPSISFAESPSIPLSVTTLISILFFILLITKVYEPETMLQRIKLSPLPPEEKEMVRAVQKDSWYQVVKRFQVYFYPNSTASQVSLNELSISNNLDDLRVVAEAWYLIAKQSGSESALERSITVLERLQRIDPTSPIVRDTLGLRYLFKQNFEKARDSFSSALEQKPDYWYAYLHLGELERQACNPRQAIEWYKKAEAYIPSAQAEIAEAQQEIASPRIECQK